MAIRITGELLGGSFSSWASDQNRVWAHAVRAGVAAATDGMRLELRQQVVAAGLKSIIGNLIRGKTFPPEGRGSFRAAGNIYGNGPRAQLLLDVFYNGAVIRPSGGGKYLCIPTAFNRGSGRRGSQAKVTPQELIASKRSFVRPAADKPSIKVWFAEVNAASAKSARGRPLPRAYAAGLLSIGSGRRARVEQYLAAGVVPMFVLIPQATIRKFLDPDPIAQRWADAIPDLIDRALPSQ